MVQQALEAARVATTPPARYLLEKTPKQHTQSLAALLSVNERRWPHIEAWSTIQNLALCRRPSVFLRLLHESGALVELLPEIDCLYGVPQTALHHPEIDTGVHIEMVTDMAVALAPGDASVLYAALTHDLGKGLTNPTAWPKHLGHEASGLEPLARLNTRWQVPDSAARLALNVCRDHLDCHRAFVMRTGSVLDLLERTGAFQDSSHFDQLLLSCEADKRGRGGQEAACYPQADHLRAVAEAGRTCLAEMAAKGVSDPERRRRAMLDTVQQLHGPKRTPEKPRKSRPGVSP